MRNLIQKFVSELLVLERIRIFEPLVQHACMYVCMYVCMYACMHACIHACMYVCMCVYVCMYVCMCVYVCVCMCVCVSGVALPEARGRSQEGPGSAQGRLGTRNWAQHGSNLSQVGASMGPT